MKIGINGCVADAGGRFCFKKARLEAHILAHSLDSGGKKPCRQEGEKGAMPRDAIIRSGMHPNPGPPSIKDDGNANNPTRRRMRGKRAHADTCDVPMACQPCGQAQKVSRSELAVGTQEPKMVEGRCSPKPQNPEVNSINN